MNRKQFLIALAVLVVLAGAGAAVILSERSGWKSADSRAGQKLIPNLRIDQIAEIGIRDAAGELHLVRGEASWSVRERAGFAAETDRVAELLVKLAELKIVQSEALPDAQRARLACRTEGQGAGRGDAARAERHERRQPRALASGEEGHEERGGCFALARRSGGDGALPYPRR